VNTLVRMNVDEEDSGSLSRREQGSATGVPPQGFRCAPYFYKKLYIRKLQFEKDDILSFVIRIRNAHTHTGSPSIVLFNMCYVLFSYACILFGQGFIYRYIFVAMYNFVPPFREAKFCGVPSCV
jgi:hypothetical protein